MGATRTIVISGGADGIGRATARAFAQLGDYVVVADNAPDRGERTVGEIIAEGGSAEFQFLDVRDKASVDQTIEQTLARRGSIDVAVANAGIVRRSRQLRR